MPSKTFKYIPKTTGFSGYLMLTVPTFRERLAEMKTLGIELSGEGADIKPNIKPSIELFEKLLDKVMGMIAEVNLVYKPAEGPEFLLNTASDLEVYAECMPLILELMEVLKSGISMGKS